MSYTPMPGTIPAKTINFLRDQAAIGRFWVSAAEIEDHVDQTPIGPYLERAVSSGVLRRQHMESDRRRSEYALGDGKPLPRRPRERDEPLEPRPKPAKPAPLAWPPATGAAPPTTNPPGEPPMATTAQRKMSSMEYADTTSMQITDDPITPRTNVGTDKYAPLFVQMKPGQAIKCQPGDAPKVANAMRKWAKENRAGCVVRAVRHYPADKLGRVWLLEGKGSK